MRPFPLTLSRLKLSSGFGTIRYILLFSSRGQRGEQSRGEERGREGRREEESRAEERGGEKSGVER